MTHWGQKTEGQFFTLNLVVEKTRNKLNAKVGGKNGKEQISVSIPEDSP